MKTLWFAKGPDVEKQRYSTFLACFHLQDAMEELQALEAPVAAFCCLLTYLMMQVTGTVTVSSAVSPYRCDLLVSFLAGLWAIFLIIITGGIVDQIQ